MRRARGKGPDDRDLIGIAQEIKDRDLASKPAELRSVLEAAARTRQEQRLHEVRALPQNQPTGIALLVAGAVVAVAGVLVAFCALSPIVFGAFAKVTFLVLGLAGAMIVAVEDPFHEDLGEAATPIERLKLQGKVLVVTTMIAVLCTGLSFYTDHLKHCHVHDDLVKRIEKASNSTVSGLEVVLRRGEELDKKLRTLNDAVDHSLAGSLKQIGEATAKIAALPTRAELPSKDELDRKLAALATAESVQQLATADHLSQLATSVSRLATAESVSGLATSVSRLATADSVSHLATADSVSRLAAAESVSRLATAESVSRLMASVASLGTADSVSRLAESVNRLATAESVNRLATSMSSLATADSVNGVSRAVTELGQLLRRPSPVESPVHTVTINPRPEPVPAGAGVP
jgi:hypothetical protein